MNILPLKDWVNINSGSHNFGGLARMADCLETHLRTIGWEPERISLSPVRELDGRDFQPGDALRVKIRPEAPLQVIFSGHMDTVFGPEHPFQQYSDLDGRATGPGVCDMKGGLFIMIEAIKRFLDQDTTGNVGGTIIITADEEVGSPGSTELLLETAKTAHLALVYESALPDGELVCKRMGTGTFRITAAGKSAHTGRDFASGRNAVAALAALMVDCHKLNEILPDAIINVGSLHGGGPVNVVPDYAEAWLNVRIGRQETVSKFRKALDRLITETTNEWDGIRLDCAGTIARPPKVETKADVLLHGLWNRAESSVGLPLSGKRETGGSSDGNLFSSVGLPCLDGIGIKGGAIHSPDEFALLDSIPEQINKSVAFLNLLSADPKFILRLSSKQT